MEKPEQFGSRKEWEDFIWHKVLKEISNLSSTDKIQSFLEKIISDYEKRLIIRRLTAILLLRENLNYREIGEILWVSPSTISAIKRGLLTKTKYLSGRNIKKSRNPQAVSGSESMTQSSPSDSFITNLENLLGDILKGKTNPKYRWRFLRK